MSGKSTTSIPSSIRPGRLREIGKDISTVLKEYQQVVKNCMPCLSESGDVRLNALKCVLESGENVKKYLKVNKKMIQTEMLMDASGLTETGEILMRSFPEVARSVMLRLIGEGKGQDALKCYCKGGETRYNDTLALRDKVTAAIEYAESTVDRSDTDAVEKIQMIKDRLAKLSMNSPDVVRKLNLAMIACSAYINCDDLKAQKKKLELVKEQVESFATSDFWGMSTATAPPPYDLFG
jgi:hypothetical protein